MEKDLKDKISDLQTKFYKACHGKKPLHVFNEAAWDKIDIRSVTRMKKTVRLEK